MKQYSDLNLLLNDSLRVYEKYGFDDSVAVKIEKKSKDFMEIRLVKPVDKTIISVLLNNNYQIDDIRELFYQRLAKQYPKRFGLFNTQKIQADAIFDTWQELYAEWFQKKGSSILNYNIPLLFDYVSNDIYEYWTKNNQDIYGTQRMIISVYQPRTERFADLFITNMSEDKVEEFKNVMTSHIILDKHRLFGW